MAKKINTTFVLESVTLYVPLPKKLISEFVKAVESYSTLNSKKLKTKMTAERSYQGANNRPRVYVTFSPNNKYLFYEMFFKFCNEHNLNFIPPEK